MKNKTIIIGTAAVAVVALVAKKVYDTYTNAMNFADEFDFSITAPHIQLKEFNLNVSFVLQIINPTNFAFTGIELNKVAVAYNGDTFASTEYTAYNITVQPNTTFDLPRITISILLNTTTIEAIVKLVTDATAGTAQAIPANATLIEKITAIGEVLMKNSDLILKRMIVTIKAKVKGIDTGELKFNAYSGDMVNGLGMTAQAGEPPRKTKDRSIYASLFPAALMTEQVIVDKPSILYDTVEQMAQMGVHRKYTYQTEEIAKVLKGENDWETALNIYDFIYNYYDYVPDGERELLRSPARLFHDGGGDCDCFSITIACILNNLNIPFSYRLLWMDDGNHTDYHHVYVVAHSHSFGDIVIDPVEYRFNYEHSGKKKDFKVM